MVAVHTGEEDEETIYQVRGKLFSLSEQNQWREKGTGIIKLNLRRTDGEGARLGEFMVGHGKVDADWVFSDEERRGVYRDIERDVVQRDELLVCSAGSEVLEVQYVRGRDVDALQSPSELDSFCVFLIIC